MKKLLLATALTFSASAALAGGLGEAVTDPVVTAPAAGPSWAGFYVGADIGYTFGGTTHDIARQGTAGAPPARDLDGVVGGLQVGYLWETKGSLVYGVEADLGLKGPEASWAGRVTNPNDSYYGIDSIDQSLELKAKLGYAIDDRNMFYGFAGGIAAKTNNTLGCNRALVAPIVPTGCATAFHTNQKSTATGWVAGIGYEGKIDDNWSVKFEYTHTDLGTTDVVLVDPNARRYDNRNFDTKYDVITVGVNYRF